VIAADSCSFVHWLQGGDGPDVDVVGEAMESKTLVLPPVVVCELLSDPMLLPEDEEQIVALPTLSIRDGYWLRAGLLRRRILRHKRKARLGDVLVAQICIDHGVPLITRDRDFRHFAPVASLRFLP